MTVNTATRTVAGDKLKNDRRCQTQSHCRPDRSIQIQGGEAQVEPERETQTRNLHHLRALTVPLMDCPGRRFLNPEHSHTPQTQSPWFGSPAGTG